MIVSSILDHLMKIYNRRTSDSLHVMANSVMYPEQYHERVPNQKRVIHMHLSPDITIQTPNRLNMLLEYDPNTIK